MQDESVDRDALLERDEAAGLEKRIVGALEAAPEMRIPADFAARVAARVPARPMASQATTRYGYGAMLIGMVVLFGILVALAGHSADHTAVGLTVQWTLCAQFIGLVVWFSARRHSANQA